MLLITIIKTVITLQPYRFRYVLSSLCSGTVLGKMFTVFGGLDCIGDVGTLTVLGILHKKKLCGIHNTVKVPKSTVQSKPPSTVTLHQEQYRSIRMTAHT
jgi:hypothetical protein